ncbi:MAG: diguanylate cyclase [Epsilonproteobacteria bacterium]|nr:diguanylate cyclase [Campylobacterota bacterium]
MKILLIEDDLAFQKVLYKFIEKNLLFCEVKSVTTFEELKNINEEFDLYIVDYFLPDSKNGEHIDYLIEKDKKIVIFTGNNEIAFEKYEDKVSEIVLKDDFLSLEYLLKFIKRFYKNRKLKALIAEDSKIIRKFEESVLQKIGLHTFCAENGKEALEIFEKEDIDIVITDLAMPVMDGEELIFRLRKKRKMTDLPIMVISGESDDKFVRILKFGANDYLKKPFIKEEMIIRVNNLLEIYDNMRTFKTKAQLDPLTGAYNRVFLENTIENLFNIHSKKSVAMMDIDHFKKINDTYGHQTGDEVLKHFVQIIKKSIRKSDYLVRYGGEEFLIFMPNTNKLEAFVVVEKIRNHLTPCGQVKYTFSCGIADEGDTLAEMIKIADERLYKAKREGRDRIVIK